MAFPIVAAQPEKLVAACGANRQDNREVQDVQTVLPRNQPEFDAGGARKGEFRFAVAPLLPKLQLLTILIRQQLAFGEQLLDIRVCEARRHDCQRNFEYTAKSPTAESGTAGELFENAPSVAGIVFLSLPVPSEDAALKRATDDGINL